MTAATLVNVTTPEPDGSGDVNVIAVTSALETTVFKTTAPANHFTDSKRRYQLASFGWIAQNSGSTKTLTLRMYVNKSGGTTIKLAEIALSLSTNAINRNFELLSDVVVSENGFAEATCQLRADFGLPSAAFIRAWQGDGAYHNLSPCHRSDDIDLTLTAQWSAANPSTAVTFNNPIELFA